MAETTTSPTATPKRKRDHLAAETHLAVSPTPHRFAKTIFSFQPADMPAALELDGLVEDGNRSPRSKVVDRFRHLAIKGGHEALESVEGPTIGRNPESGGGGAATLATGCVGGFRHIESANPALTPEVSRFNFDAGVIPTEAGMQVNSDDDGSPWSHKRTKILESDNILAESSTTAHGESAVTTSIFGPFEDRINSSPQVSIVPEFATTVNIGKSVRSQRTNRPVESKPRNRKRVGTPPPSSKRKGATQVESEGKGDKEQVIIIDPVRAALTWREDEITIYDPDDKDDDGTGINGIGFKPTAAVAYQRAQKRRQQLAEYKKREEREARARRNQRRREQHGGGAEMSRRRSMVRVHFSDAPPTTVMTT